MFSKLCHGLQMTLVFSHQLKCRLFSESPERTNSITSSEGMQSQQTLTDIFSKWCAQFADIYVPCVSLASHFTHFPIWLQSARARVMSSVSPETTIITLWSSEACFACDNFGVSASFCDVASPRIHNVPSLWNLKQSSWHVMYIIHHLVSSNRKLLPLITKTLEDRCVCIWISKDLPSSCYLLAGKNVAQKPVIYFCILNSNVLV